MSLPEPAFFTSWAQIEERISLSVTTESLTLEFKARVRAEKSDPRECARDLAQFANGVGGTLLVGVEEAAGPNGLKVASAIPGVPRPEEDRQWLETKVRSYLVPSDLSFDTRVLTAPDGRHVVAVNIPAFENGVVAIWHAGNEPVIEYPY